MEKKELIYNYICNIGMSARRGLKGSNLQAYYIDGTEKRVLKNYNTIIALIDCQKDYNKVYLNKNKYSSTTSRNQNLVRYYADKIEEITEKEIYQLINE